MNNEKLLTEIFTPSGKLIRVGESYTNIYGVEIEISKISKPENDADVLVEFMPKDAALSDKCWWGMFLPESRQQA